MAQTKNDRQCARCGTWHRPGKRDCPAIQRPDHFRQPRDGRDELGLISGTRQKETS